MKEIPEDRQIYISGRLWHEIYPKVNLSPFIYALHEGIDLSKYGDGIKKYYFTFIVVKPDDILNTPGTYFDQESREAEIALEMPYDKVVEATEEETIALMQKAYLEGIDLIATLPLPADFDTATFKEDVEAIFSQENWFELAMVS